MRVKLGWKSLEEENASAKDVKVKVKRHRHEVLSNGDTAKDLLARSRYVLYTTPEAWTANQAKRAWLLFAKFPQIKMAYQLALSFRAIYKCTDNKAAQHQFQVWKDSVAQVRIDEFNSVVHSLDKHFGDILNFFDNRNSYASAEFFNSKIKGFRANDKGVIDVKFFLFRLEKLFA